MNSRVSGTVESRAAISATVISIALSLWVVTNTGCVDVDGGAVEVSWTVRTFEGNTTSCGAVGLERIRVCWQALETDASSLGQCREFACSASRGITKFAIVPGRTALFLEPVCSDGMLARNYQVPPPIVRVIKEGEVATLNQLLIVASTNRDCSAGQCTCP